MSESESESESEVIPGPLGWCSWCLALNSETQAVTLMGGFALCQDCNAAGNRHDTEEVAAAKSDLLARQASQLLAHHASRVIKNVKRRLRPEVQQDPDLADASSEVVVDHVVDIDVQRDV